MKKASETLPELEETKNAYELPIPIKTRVNDLIYDNEAHEGPFRGAIDIAVDLDTPVLAPFEGTITEIVENNTLFGETRKFAKLVNYINIEHPNGEISQLCHLAKDSVLVKKGDKVTKGQKIARTGLSGWMSKPHVHWIVFKNIHNKPGFKGLKIKLECRYQNAPRA